MPQPILEFPPFRLDMDDAALWRGAQRVPLPARELAVLHYLVTHPGRLVTAEELFTQVWSNVKVSSGVVKVRIGRIRRVLGDSAETPRFIENVHGKGYRFIASLREGARDLRLETSPPSPQGARRKAQGSSFVGRRRELTELRACLEDAINGQGRLALLVGEPSIGKTRTAEELARHAREHALPALLGHCEEGEGAPPLWPWTQVMRAYTAQVSPQQLQVDLDKGAADLVQAFPELHEHCPQLHPRSLMTNPTQARFRFFDSFTLFLKNATKRQPFVIILDDVLSSPLLDTTGEPLPRRVRDSLAYRLQTLSEQCQQMPKVSSVLGLEFNRTVLEAVAANSRPSTASIGI